jgi:hypothetical protein
VAEALCALSLLEGGGEDRVRFTGLAQNSQVGPAVLLKVPMRALDLTQILGQPCEFQVDGREGGEGSWDEGAGELRPEYAPVAAEYNATAAGASPGRYRRSDTAPCTFH